MQQDCRRPSSPSNGTVTFTGNSVGDNATYTCDTGFELIGDAVTTCTQDKDGLNSAVFVPTQPICRRKLLQCFRLYLLSIFFFAIALCPNPSNIPNGTVAFAGNSVGENATYTCDSGFELIGSETAKCVLAMDESSALFVPDAPFCSRKFLTMCNAVSTRGF